MMHTRLDDDISQDILASSECPSCGMLRLLQKAMGYDARPSRYARFDKTCTDGLQTTRRTLKPNTGLTPFVLVGSPTL